MCRGPGAPGDRPAGGASTRVSRRFSLILSSKVYVVVACFCSNMFVEKMCSCLVWLTSARTDSGLVWTSASSFLQDNNSGKESTWLPHNGQEMLGLYISLKSFLIPRTVLDLKLKRVVISSLLNSSLFRYFCISSLGYLICFILEWRCCSVFR